MEKIFAFLVLFISVIANFIKFEKPSTEPSVLDEAIIVYEKTPEKDSWDVFIEAVIWKESRGVEDCIGDSGKAVGVLQIHPIMVREANRIIAMTDKSDTEHYTYDDRYDREKSIEIFNVVQGYHNREKDFDVALRIWNKNHPESYRTQILNKYKELMS